ncbi:MAG: hypothetical protein GY845_07260, partial [Planctomycetes bacterium]|nr:hypothetical protein [Planctomycetota bacterium]
VTAGSGPFAPLVLGEVIAIEAVVVSAGAALTVHGGAVIVHNFASSVGGWGTGSSQTKTIGGYQVRVDWESPGRNGNVHVTVNGRKIYITAPSDISALPKRLQNDPWVQRQVQRAFRQMRNFEASP